MDFEGPLMADVLAPPYNRRQEVEIDMLPDDVLLTIFDFYVLGCKFGHLVEVDWLQGTKKKSWESLVHVCRRWRGLVFESPRHLNLQLFCTTRTPARETLALWPVLPLLILGGVSETSVDNVIAELEFSDRIRQIELNFELDTTSQIEKLWTAMQVPFPELETLNLSSRSMSFVPVSPHSLLGGFAPRLLHLVMDSIPFPGLPKLLLSATHLVNLYLSNIPFSGYISPDAMVTYLSMLTSLQLLGIHFESPRSCPDEENRRSPPPTRSILPTLQIFWFKGVYEYLEDLVAQIDTPRLDWLSATFFNDLDFDTPELIRFVSRSPMFNTHNEAHVFFDIQTASVVLPQASNAYSEYIAVNILCREPNWQLSSLAQICTTSFPLLSTTENLFIYERTDSQLDWKDSIEFSELLLPFAAVKNIYLSRLLVPHIAPALQEMTGGSTTEMLPNLRNLYLEGFKPSESVDEGIEQFISARQLTNRPVAISVWEEDSVEETLGKFYAPSR